MRRRAICNIDKWGMQSIETLGLVAGEECGEVAKAILEHLHEGKPLSRIRDEANDLGAVCLQIIAACDALDEGEMDLDPISGDLRQRQETRSRSENGEGSGDDPEPSLF